MQPVATEQKKSGIYRLAKVITALEKQVGRQIDYAIDKLDQQRLIPQSSPSFFLSPEQVIQRAPPTRSDLVSGIAHSVFKDATVLQGEIYARNAQDQLEIIGDPEFLMLDCDPLSLPVSLKKFVDAEIYAEYRARNRCFAFLDPCDWSVRNQPRNEFAQSEEEFLLLDEAWEAFERFAGSPLYFKSLKKRSSGKPITPSQIAQSHRRMIEGIIVGRQPRSNSPLFQRSVERLAGYSALRRVSSERVALSWLAEEVSGDINDKTNRGLRNLKSAIDQYIQQLKKS